MEGLLDSLATACDYYDTRVLPLLSTVKLNNQDVATLCDDVLLFYQNDIQDTTAKLTKILGIQVEVV